MKIPPLLFALLLPLLSFGQLRKVLHQSFELADIEQIQLDFSQEYEIKKWAGNAILTEISIELYDASPSVFKYYVDNQRYEVADTTSNNRISLTWLLPDRNPIRTQKGECYEFVKIRIFIPENFVTSGQHSYRLQEESIPD